MRVVQCDLNGLSSVDQLAADWAETLHLFVTNAGSLDGNVVTVDATDAKADAFYRCPDFGRSPVSPTGS